MLKFLNNLISSNTGVSSNRFIYIFVVVNCVLMVWFELLFYRVITWEFITLVGSLITIVTGGKVSQKKLENNTKNDTENE